jgi:hypothetical protein
VQRRLRAFLRSSTEVMDQQASGERRPSCCVHRIVRDQERYIAGRYFPPGNPSRDETPRTCNRLVVSSDSSPTPLPRPHTPLLKTIARTHDWSKRLLDKSAVSQTDLARQLRLNRRYLDRVLGCAFLAPDILEAILDGRQPPDLTFDKLTRSLPLRWSGQRKQLGFCTPGAGR